MTNYDLTIVGSGPGGYVAGLYASRRKLKTCVIEKDLVGGTCLNRGCIPTKSILNSAAIVSTIENAHCHGIDVTGHKVNFQKVMSRKDEVVRHLRTGIEALCKAGKIDLVRGMARIKGPGAVQVDNSQIINAGHIIVACGSRPAGLANVKVDEKDILSSNGILSMERMPESIVIIGGGVIGCEFASVFNAFGAKVTIVEFLDRIVPGQSKEASRKLEVIFKKKGIDVLTSSRVDSVKKTGCVTVTLSGGRALEAEKALIAVGRVPCTEDMGLEEAGVRLENGRILVDENLKTTVKNIFAIGDCIGGPLLAHKASYDGILACDNILGEDRKVDYSNVPNCIWTEPQIASVGKSEDEAKAQGLDVRAAKFPYLASGKAYLEAKTEGFVRVVGDTKGNILGVEMFGPEACDLIGEAVLAKTRGVNIRDWARVVHGHPTLSEVFQEVSHVFCGTAIHTI